MARPVFALRVRAEPGVAVIRSLRGWLKQGLREFGLRCVSIEEVTKEDEMVDVRKYTSGLITPDEVRDGPIETKIVGVYISEKHDVPVLELETGDQFFAWPGNGRKLARAYGDNSDDWIGHQIRLELGTYTDKDGNSKDTVNLIAVSSRDGNADGGTPQRADPNKLPAPVKRPLKDDLADDVPF
jgi:hypothetical protein